MAVPTLPQILDQFCVLCVHLRKLQNCLPGVFFVRSSTVLPQGYTIASSHMIQMIPVKPIVSKKKFPHGCFHIPPTSWGGKMCSMSNERLDYASSTLSHKFVLLRIIPKKIAYFRINSANGGILFSPSEKSTW